MKIIHGNIFTSGCQTLVNTVNCVGVMGAGIAYEFRLRYPDLFKEYIQLCNARQIAIGKLWLYKGRERFVLNFPTKTHWKYPSKTEYLEAGLQCFQRDYKQLGITSIAFPVLGASNGGLEEDVSLEIMTRYLGPCEIPIEIYRLNPDASDDLFEEFKKSILALSIQEITDCSGIREGIARDIKLALSGQNDLRTMSSLLTIKGVGDKSLEKMFQFIRNKPNTNLKLKL